MRIFCNYFLQGRQHFHLTLPSRLTCCLCSFRLQETELCLGFLKSFVELFYFSIRIQGQVRKTESQQGFAEDETLKNTMKFQGSRQLISSGKISVVLYSE